MAHYVIHDADGKIIRQGNCPDGEEQHQVHADGEHLLLAMASAHDSIDINTKEVQVFVDPLAGQFRNQLAHLPEYVQERMKSYPSITAQLDMMWHAQNEGTAPKMQPWFDTIKAVKDGNPKVGESTPTLVYTV